LETTLWLQMQTKSPALEPTKLLATQRVPANASNDGSHQLRNKTFFYSESSSSSSSNSFDDPIHRSIALSPLIRHFLLADESKVRALSRPVKFISLVIMQGRDFTSDVSLLHPLI